jgi:energy-coupling factor transporter ATP-binding protein EcfA2
MIFVLNQVSVSTKGREQESRPILRDLSLTFNHGECVGILGQEGSGKTTLLNVLGGLISPDTGSVIRTPANRERDDQADRLTMAFTFQFPEEQFLCQNVSREFQEMLALRKIASGEATVLMEQSLRSMGLDPASVCRRSPFSLSLGESRRLATALAIAVKPEALLMDEPTSGLDAGGVSCTARVIEDACARGISTIVATHDVDFIAGVAGRILILDGGRIAADGPAELILSDGPLLHKHGYDKPGREFIAAQRRREG